MNYGVVRAGEAVELHHSYLDLVEEVVVDGDLSWEMMNQPNQGYSAMVSGQQTYSRFLYELPWIAGYLLIFLLVLGFGGN